MDKDNMKEVAKIWAWKMATPKKVVGAWEFNTEESALKSPWKKISVFDLPEISGRVCLLYDDGTITKCSVEKGIMQGGYLHYDKSSDGQTDPMNMGRLLEKGDYRNGWRTGEWLSHIKLIKKQMEAAGLSLPDMPVFEEHTKGCGGKRDMMIVFPSDPPFSTTLCDLPAPVGLVQIGDRVEECLILKHLERFRDRSMDTSQQEEKKKEAEKKKKTIPNIIRIPNQTRGR